MCEEGEFKCNDSKCIQEDYVCDGFLDCNDGSDEFNCGKSISGDGVQMGFFPFYIERAIMASFEKHCKSQLNYREDRTNFIAS